MNARQIPLVLLVGGVTLKALLVALTKIGDFPAVIRFLTIYDPAAFMFANWSSSLFFDPRRLAPSPGEAQIFEVLLIVGFGMECWLLGHAVRWLLQRNGRVKMSVQ